MSPVETGLEIARILETGMRSANMTGEIDVSTGSSKNIRWVGQPNDGDVLVEVRISPLNKVAAE